ncbi:hypothetical protein BCR32DRAFT_329299 [Anaeromyces robustus]|uniref:Uncharacterized protein n=1 Tax=Anaeromyces robustus TaxID=1754192 RepID=A0A1Y1WTC4_9FUNG|nr:hypothetical protein BCR32DRAFT_329299 [Anaeromyces robustus]|eukprot:ORX76548.1 hypothetical protein BCR32DRAFT_329299 [Anaeromyces robustus]
MNLNVEKHSKNVLIHSFFMIILYISFVILASYYGSLPLISLGYIQGFSLVRVGFLVIFIIGILKRNENLVDGIKEFITLEKYETFNYSIVILCSINFLSVWKEESLNKYKKINNHRFDNYSDEELKKKLIFGSCIMLIAGIIKLKLMKNYTTYLKKSLKNISLKDIKNDSDVKNKKEL